VPAWPTFLVPAIAGVAIEVLAGERAVEEARARPSFGDAPPDAVLVDLDARQAMQILLVNALRPEIRRLLRMTIRRDHEEATRIVGPRGALPSSMARRIEPPAIILIDFVAALN
jgi:hypothetical protein